MIWKDIPGLIQKTLENPEFKDNLHYEGEILRFAKIYSTLKSHIQHFG